MYHTDLTNYSYPPGPEERKRLGRLMYMCGGNPQRERNVSAETTNANGG